MSVRTAAPAGLLSVLSANMLLDALEVSAMVVALPSIGAELNVGPAVLQWTLSGFALGFGGLLLFGGPVLGLFGRRRAYLGALVLFAVASLLGAVTASVELLLVTRFVKGCCVALTAPTGLAIITATFPTGRGRDRAVSVYTLFGASGFSAGLVCSGLLTEASWRWTLLFPSPVALALFVFGLRLIPADTEPRRYPLPRLKILRRRSLSRASLAAGALNGSYWGFLLVLTLHLQQRLGWSPARTGIALLPASLPLALTALWSGLLVRRFGAALLVTLGCALATTGYGLLALDPAKKYLTDVLPALAFVGLGFVLAFAALHVHAVTGIPPDEQRMASSLYQSAVQLGGALTVVLVAVLLARDGPALLAVTAVGLAGTLVASTGVVKRLT